MKKLKFHKHNKQHFRLPLRLNPARILRLIGLTLSIIGLVFSFTFYMNYSSGVSARVYNEKFGTKDKQVTASNNQMDKKLAIIALEIAGAGGIIYTGGIAMKHFKKQKSHR
jgi:hypothetical protein